MRARRLSLRHSRETFAHSCSPRARRPRVPPGRPLAQDVALEVVPPRPQPPGPTARDLGGRVVPLGQVARPRAGRDARRRPGGANGSAPGRGQGRDEREGARGRRRRPLSDRGRRRRRHGRLAAALAHPDLLAAVVAPRSAASGARRPLLAPASLGDQEPTRPTTRSVCPSGRRSGSSNVRDGRTSAVASLSPSPSRPPSPRRQPSALALDSRRLSALAPSRPTPQRRPAIVPRLVLDLGPRHVRPSPLGRRVQVAQQGQGPPAPAAPVDRLVPHGAHLALAASALRSADGLAAVGHAVAGAALLAARGHHALRRDPAGCAPALCGGRRPARASTLDVRRIPPLAPATTPYDC